MKQEIDNNAMWAAFRQELALQGELQVVAAINNALNNLGFTIKETSTIIPIPLNQGKNNMGISEATKQKLEDNLNKALEKETPESWNEFLEKQGEQKPDTNCLLSWSETDEKMLKSLEGIVKDYWAKAEQEKNEIKIREASNVSYFLKTIQKSPLCWIKCSDELPNRDGIYLVVTDGRHNDVYDMARYDSIKGWHKASEIIYWMPIPQLNNKSIIEQKPAWSEEDENYLNSCITKIEIDIQNWEGHGKTMIDVDKKIISWLKSIKDKYTWKPSDEQMEALKESCSEHWEPDGLDPLCTLYQDLKKLKEEQL